MLIYGIMNKDPFRGMTRGIPDAVEQTPAHQAMLAGQRYVPTTFGDLASKLVEQGEIAPAVDAVCDYLAITPEELKDPTIHFSDAWEAEEFTDTLHKRWTHEYVTTEGPKGKAFDDYLVESAGAWTDNSLPAVAVSLEEEIATAPFPETTEEGRQLALKELRASVYRSGLAVAPDTLVATALSFEEAPFSSGEIISEAAAVIEDVSILHGLDGDTRVSDIVLGEQHVEEFRSFLAHRFKRKANAYASQKIAPIVELITPPNADEHFLHIGGEK